MGPITKCMNERPFSIIIAEGAFLYEESRYSIASRWMHEWIYIGMNIRRGVGCGSSGWSMNDDDTEQAMSKCTVSHGAIFIIVNRSIELWCWWWMEIRLWIDPYKTCLVVMSITYPHAPEDEIRLGVFISRRYRSGKGRQWPIRSKHRELILLSILVMLAGIKLQMSKEFKFLCRMHL